MTQTIKAIETHYKGYRFRSRLEARWAVFFDALGAEWKYESEGFEKHFGEYIQGDDPPSNPVRYLPDFYLPRTDTWVEVKGSDAAFQADSRRLESFLDWRCPLPGFTNCDVEPHRSHLARGVLVLGDIPDPSQWGFHLHPIIRHYKGLRQRYAWFVTNGWVEVGQDQTLSMLCAISGLDLAAEVSWSPKSVFVPSARAHKSVIDAYRAARSARFEHGETPR